MPAQRQILGLINHAHAASAELLQDAVVRDGLVDHRGAPESRGCRKVGRSREDVKAVLPPATDRLGTADLP
jgi:hypothetical protein